MAEKNPKYYWLKLKEDFFGDKRIKKLRRGETGDTAVIIYLEMMLRALKTGGRLTFENLEDSFYEELALDLNEDEENCKTALEALIACGLLETADGKTYLLPEVANCTGSESESLQRVREYREKKKTTQRNANVTECNADVTKCNADVTECNTEIEKEIEKEKEIEIEIDTDTEIKKESDKNIYSKEEEEGAALKAAVCLPLRDNKKYYINDDEIKKWKELYPRVDILQELKTMTGWLQANPEKRRDRDNLPRFINAWFTRKQETPVETQVKKQTNAVKEHKLPEPDEYHDIKEIDKMILKMTPTLPPKKIRH